MVEQQQLKIKALTQEKDMLNSQIQTLQNSLKEQGAVIDQLKGLVNNSSRGSSLSREFMLSND